MVCTESESVRDGKIGNLTELPCIHLPIHSSHWVSYSTRLTMRNSLDVPGTFNNFAFYPYSIVTFEQF